MCQLVPTVIHSYSASGLVEMRTDLPELAFKTCKSYNSWAGHCKISADPGISISDSGIIRGNDPLSDIVTASQQRQQRDRDRCNVYTMWWSDHITWLKNVD